MLLFPQGEIYIYVGFSHLYPMGYEITRKSLIKIYIRDKKVFNKKGRRLKMSD